MNTPLEKFFDGRIFVINLEKRPDRMAQMVEQFRMFGITRYERFEASVVHREDGSLDGNAGCVMSHRRLLDLIVANKWRRTLILEDDAAIRHGDFMRRFAEMSNELLPTTQMLYLGGHYGEPPIARLSPRVIRCGQMLTTSSYGITWQMAAKMAPHIHGSGPIDSLYGAFHRDNLCVISDPVLMYQRPSFSDLQERDMSNSNCMLDDSDRFAATV